jgi:hypothetical protein
MYVYSTFSDVVVCLTLLTVFFRRYFFFDGSSSLVLLHQHVDPLKFSKGFTSWRSKAIQDFKKNPNNWLGKLYRRMNSAAAAAAAAEERRQQREQQRIVELIIGAHHATMNAHADTMNGVLAALGSLPRPPARGPSAATAASQADAPAPEDLRVNASIPDNDDMEQLDG